MAHHPLTHHLIPINALDTLRPGSWPRSSLLAVGVCILISILLMTWPGDVPWGGDDATLIATAVKSKHDHRLISAGLGGSFGYPYGPLPSQFYQLLATVSENPTVLARMHAGFFALVTAFALLYLARSLKLSIWFAPMVMVGPFFWFYTRLMWDNPFAMPVGTLLLASYLDYANHRSTFAFYLTVCCIIALPLIHPMTLPLVLAVGGHAIWVCRSEFTKHWRGLIVIAICTALLSGRYVQRIAEQVGHSPGLIAPRSDALSRTRAFLFPLMSGRLFTGSGFFDERGPEIGLEQNKVVQGARAFTLVSYPIIWLGILIAAYRIPRKMSLTTLCLGVLILQSAMDAWLRISPYPHYHCGTWAVAVVLLWTGLDAIPIRRLKITLAVSYASCLIIATFAFAFDIHRDHGGKVWYGPNLQSQLFSGTAR